MKRLSISEGDVFGYITVIGDAPCGRHRKIRGKCKCGVIKDFYLDALRKGSSTSCGCSRGSMSSTYSSNKQDSLYWKWVDLKLKADYIEEGWMVYDTFKEWSYSNGYKEGYTLMSTLEKGYTESSSTWVPGSYFRYRRDSRYYDIVSPEGINICVYNMAEFCRENDLDSGSMSKVASGKLISHKGWTRYGSVLN